MDLKMVSVIIPTYNAFGYIDKLIAKLNEQIIEEETEIIVIDSSSNDGTAELCSNMPNVKFISIEKKDFDHGSTRNKAAAIANGDILVFMTQDALPYDNYFLSNLIEPLRNSNVAAAYGRQIARSDALIAEKLTREFNYPVESFTKSKNDIDALGIKTFYLTNVCSAFKKSELEGVGFFPNRTISNEDMLATYKLIMSGKQIAYVSNARVIHSHNYTYRQQLQRNFDIGVSLRMNRYILEQVKAESEGISFVRHINNILFNKMNIVILSFRN